jgi:hypothetical protein
LFTHTRPLKPCTIRQPIWHFTGVDKTDVRH